MMKLKKAEKEILALIAGDWPPSESQIAVHLHLGKSQAEAAIKSLREKRMVKL